MHMTYIPRLVVSEYKQAQLILYEDLFFESSKLTLVNLVQVPYWQVQSWKLKDDLDLADFGESWLTYPENEGLLKGSELALLQHIQQSAEL
jgi:hypothetical protein